MRPDPKKYYKQFIDDLVAIRESVSMARVNRKGWPDLPENKAINAFIASLTGPQKSVLCQLLQKERDSGIHDTLVYLNDRLNLEEMEIRVEGAPLPLEPFDTTLYYDWVCRCEGDSWPDTK